MSGVLVLGAGGREHALCWKIAASPERPRLFAAPGNPGISEHATLVPISPTDAAGLGTFCAEEGIDLVVVGPEAPLVDGVADGLRAAGVPVFGPGTDGAALEGSKAFAKRFMQRHGIPTATSHVFEDSEALITHLGTCDVPVVVKADGLAAGKGVLVCHTREDALEAGRVFALERRFGRAGSTVLCEEFLEGEEATLLVLRDESGTIALPALQDHKRREEGDRGPNTGGMGAYTPVRRMDAGTLETVQRQIVEPTHRGLLADGIDFRGVIYVGLMLGPKGPRVVEYNVRFGDPECQPLMVAMRSDLLPLLRAVAEGRLSTAAAPTFAAGTTLCTVLVDRDYPGRGEPGGRIEGAEHTERDGTCLFHSGTTRGADGTVRAGGGRVLSVTAMGADVAEAREAVERRIASVSWERMAWRRDIGHRAAST